MKEYKQKTNTLRLLLMYSQFKDIDDVVFAFNVLQDKDYEKSVYIEKAIAHYDATKDDSAEITEALFPVRCMNFIRSYYGVNSKKDVKNLLSLGVESTTYQNAKERMLKNEEPREGLLGFNRNKPEAVALHKRLFEMDVRPRIMLIAAAIKKYVMDGMDSAALMACSYKMVYDSINEYEASSNKMQVVDNFYNLLQQAKSFPEKY